MNKYVLPHFAEFRNFNQAFDEATLDRETGRRTSFIKTKSMNKIFLEEMPPIELRSSISTQLDSTVLHDILTQEELKHQAAIIIQRKFRQYMAKHILDYGKNKS